MKESANAVHNRGANRQNRLASRNSIQEEAIDDGRGRWGIVLFSWIVKLLRHLPQKRSGADSEARWADTSRSAIFSTQPPRGSKLD